VVEDSEKYVMKNFYNLYFSLYFVQATKEEGISMTYSTQGGIGIHTFCNNIKMCVCVLD
jgi:hypothetical protein